jgi:glycosyltransferase involved in cell wall biosynthesis
MSYALRGPSGTATYLACLTRALREEGAEVVELADEGRGAPGRGGLRSARNLARDGWWVQAELPRRARAEGADVLHHPLPALAARAPCPQVVTVHDLAFERLPEHFAPAFRRYAHQAHRAAARGAQAVVCVSQTTSADARARWGVAPERIVVAPHGPGQPLPVVARAATPRHLLYVGDDEPRKNLGVLRDAHARYRAAGGTLPLVLAGRAPGGDGPAGPERLAELLAHAAALVHPALHEGFGLTPLEAMAAGTPVIAARTPGLSETCGDAVLYADPDGAAGLATLLQAVATDPALRADLSRRGLQRAAAFDWRACASRHIEAYTLALTR